MPADAPADTPAEDGMLPRTVPPARAATSPPVFTARRAARRVVLTAVSVLPCTAAEVRAPARAAPLVAAPVFTLAFVPAFSPASAEPLVAELPALERTSLPIFAFTPVRTPASRPAPDVDTPVPALTPTPTPAPTPRPTCACAESAIAAVSAIAAGMDRMENLFTFDSFRDLGDLAKQIPVPTI